MSDPKKPDVLLRPLETADAQNLAELANNKKIYDMIRDFFPFPYEKKHALEFIEHCKNEDPVVTFGIIYQDHLAGVIGLILQQDVYRNNAELGYWLGEPFWGKGIATAAVRKMIDYAFIELKRVRLYSGVFESNPASMRVLEKCGFQQDGLFKKSVIKNDVIMDEYRFGLINPYNAEK